MFVIECEKSSGCEGYPSSNDLTPVHLCAALDLFMFWLFFPATMNSNTRKHIGFMQVFNFQCNLLVALLNSKSQYVRCPKFVGSQTGNVCGIQALVCDFLGANIDHFLMHKHFLMCKQICTNIDHSLMSNTGAKCIVCEHLHFNLTLLNQAGWHLTEAGACLQIFQYIWNSALLYGVFQQRLTLGWQLHRK